MKISELIAALERMAADFGDMRVAMDFSQGWSYRHPEAREMFATDMDVDRVYAEDHKGIRFWGGEIPQTDAQRHLYDNSEGVVRIYAPYPD